MISESHTRRNIIDKRLISAGWNISSPEHVTTELDIWVGLPEGVLAAQYEHQGHQYADYALLGEDGYPLAIVEAKKTSKDARVGQEQARQYANNIKQNNPDRPIPFVFYTNGHDIFFWDTEKYPPRKIYGFPTRKDLERMLFLRQNGKPFSQELINREISGRPYQIEALKSVFEEIENHKRKFLLVMATGTGKTRTCVSLVDVLMRVNRVQRVLFLVDRIALRNQALDAFKEYLPNAPSWPKQGETEIVTDRRVYCTTYPTMLNTIENTDCQLSPHFFDLIVADESHRSIYNSYKNIFDYFDAFQLGLTATPKDAIEHNTFSIFNCEDGIPTFAYSYEEAVNNSPPFLSDFDVFRIKSKFQKEGIHKNNIPLNEQKRLLAEGKEPKEINYEGTDLEKKVTNKGTNALIIQEFMDTCIKDESGTLPGKTIIFAMTKKHAYRLQEIFDDLYPEHKGNLAKVIVSDDSRVHGKGGLLDQFTTKDMPRVAISVDMLDTGIDVREIVNLVFAKPVFSFTKFWQMIGRGTRLLEPKKMKPWCLKKDKFLIIDCWDNFEYFKMNPTGREDKPSKPLPVRLFESRLKKLQVCQENQLAEYQDVIIDKLKKDIEKLPPNNVVILEAKTKLINLTEAFWKTLNEKQAEYLRCDIAPLMRTRTTEDFAAMSFELNVQEYSIAKLEGTEKSSKKGDALKEIIIEKVSDLPLSVNVVAKEKTLIESVLYSGYIESATEPDLEMLIERLSPLMKYREEGIRPTQDEFNLRDITLEKEFIQFGPSHERVTIQKYREKVEALLRKLEEENAILKRIKAGEPVNKEDVDELANVLLKYDPYPTEQNLQKAFDARQVSFLDLIKYIMGIGELKTFSEKVSEAFAEFIATHNNSFTAKQIQFLTTLQTFIIENGCLTKKDLVSDPFTRLHARGILGLFQKHEQDEIMKFAERILKVA